MGFLCYVCGKTDPSEFFYGMRLTFDGAPHLVQLKQAIEARTVQDNALPDGSRYIITDLEILDLRLNMWTPLDSRAQLYSGCHVCAIRDNASATSAGPIDVARKMPQHRALGFALDVESTFRALDVENRGLVSLSNVLNVFRHDLNYAVDFFQMIDVRNCGQVTLQDLSSATAKKPADFWKILQLRISRGGSDPGAQSGRMGLTYLNSNENATNQLQNYSPRSIGGGGGSPMSGASASLPNSPFSPSSPGQKSAGSGLSGAKKSGIAAAILAQAKAQKEKDEKESGKDQQSSAASNNNLSATTGGGGGGGSPTNSSLGGTGSESKAVASARKVVELFQSASKSKSPLGGKGVSGAMAKMRELANKNRGGTSPSIAGSNSTISTQNPSASARRK